MEDCGVHGMPLDLVPLLRAQPSRLGNGRRTEHRREAERAAQASPLLTARALRRLEAPLDRGAHQLELAPEEVHLRDRPPRLRERGRRALALEHRNRRAGGIPERLRALFRSRVPVQIGELERRPTGDEGQFRGLGTLRRLPHAGLRLVEAPGELQRRPQVDEEREPLRIVGREQRDGPLQQGRRGVAVSAGERPTRS